MKDLASLTVAFVLSMCLMFLMWYDPKEKSDLVTFNTKVCREQSLEQLEQIRMLVNAPAASDAAKERFVHQMCNTRI